MSQPIAGKAKDQRRLYGDLAWIWPIVSPPEHYVEEAGLFRKLIEKNSRAKVRTLLHLGCGAGHIDLTLKRHFRITGIDLSEKMLAIARPLNPEVVYCQGDMRTVRLRKEFDAVVIADSITYMLSKRDLRKAFVTAWTHLKPGGVFCTYAELTVERFEQNKTEVTTCERGGIEIVFIENTFDPDPKDTTCELTCVYLIRERGRLRMETDRHIAGLFRLGTWNDLLEDVGFDVRQTVYPGESFPVFVCAKAQ